MAVRRIIAPDDPEYGAPDPGVFWSPGDETDQGVFDSTVPADPVPPYTGPHVTPPPGPTPIPSPNPTDPPPDERYNPPPAPPPDPAAPPPAPPAPGSKAWWESATGLFEGPRTSWGMDRTAPQLPGFPQWDTATSLKYRFGREVAKYAPTADNAAKVIQSALDAGWDIRKDDRDPTMFWFNNPDGGWEAVRLLSGSNTWEFNWGSNATGGAEPDETGPFEPPAPTTETSETAPASPPASTTDVPWAPNVPYTPPTTPTPYTTPAQQRQEESIQTQMRQALLDLLNQPEVNAETLQNDPAVRAQRIQAQRAEERQRGQLMEQNALEGLSDSGAEQTDLAGIRQQRSESEAAFIGQLAIQHMQARREDIRAAIQIATQQGQFIQAQQLSRELANLNAQLTREEIQARLGDNAAARALQERLSNNQLTQQDRQFLLSLGFSYDQLEVSGNANAASPLLNY